MKLMYLNTNNDLPKKIVLHPHPTLQHILRPIFISPTPQFLIRLSSVYFLSLTFSVALSLPYPLSLLTVSPLLFRPVFNLYSQSGDNELNALFDNLWLKNMLRSFISQ